MIVFVKIAIGRCCAGHVRRRTWLGLSGVTLVVSAGFAAYGINSAFGMVHITCDGRHSHNVSTKTSIPPPTIYLLPIDRFSTHMVICQTPTSKYLNITFTIPTLYEIPIQPLHQTNLYLYVVVPPDEFLPFSV